MGMCVMYSFRYRQRPMRRLGEEEDRESFRSGSSSSGDGDSRGRGRTSRSNDGHYDQHPALWKRTIPKGRRCEPLDFSGLILYDEHGNRLGHHFTPDPYSQHQT